MLSILMSRFSTLISVFFIVSFCPLLFAATDTTPPKANSSNSDTPIGLVIWTKGNVSAAQPSQAARKLDRRSKIFAHDVISTDGTSTGQIAFTDSSVYSLNTGTQFKIDDYNYKKDAAPAENKSVMSLVKGGFRSITGSIPKENPNGYQVNTPVATIGVRGTQYSTIISAKKGVLFMIDHGSIKVANKTGSIELTECKASVNMKNCMRYASVASATSKPMALAKMPAEFANQPPIAPVSQKEIASISKGGITNNTSGKNPGPGAPSSGGTGGGSSGGSSKSSGNSSSTNSGHSKSGGNTDSFCIK